MHFKKQPLTQSFYVFYGCYALSMYSKTDEDKIYLVKTATKLKYNLSFICKLVFPVIPATHI